ncbi:hypothetical protein L195_g061736, partial [Trifolium pratense]
GDSSSNQRRRTNPPLPSSAGGVANPNRNDRTTARHGYIAMV